MKNKEVIRQEIVIASEPEGVFKELLVWGQSSWWPKGSLMKFINLTGKIDVDTMYLQKVKIPFGPKWNTRNKVVDKNRMYIKREFLNGMFEGFEELWVIPSESGVCKASYSFNYKVRGVLNRIIWDSFFKQLHIKNIDSIFKSMKEYLEEK